MENLENICLEKLNKILSSFNLKVSIVHSKSISTYQCRFIYYEDEEHWIGIWASISDMLSKRNHSIFDCLKSYYAVFSDYHFNGMSSEIYNRYKNCSNAYQAIRCLQSNCIAEFLINCDLIGV